MPVGLLESRRGVRDRTLHRAQQVEVDRAALHAELVVVDHGRGLRCVVGQRVPSSAIVFTAASCWPTIGNAHRCGPPRAQDVGGVAELRRRLIQLRYGDIAIAVLHTFEPACAAVMPSSMCASRARPPRRPIPMSTTESAPAYSAYLRIGALRAGRTGTRKRTTARRPRRPRGSAPLGPENRGGGAVPVPRGRPRRRPSRATWRSTRRR